jgi:hypothetical protein
MPTPEVFPFEHLEEKEELLLHRLKAMLPHTLDSTSPETQSKSIIGTLKNDPRNSSPREEGLLSDGTMKTITQASRD